MLLVTVHAVCTVRRPRGICLSASACMAGMSCFALPSYFYYYAPPVGKGLGLVLGPLTFVDTRPRPIAHKSTTNSRSITKIGRRVLHDTCYIALLTSLKVKVISSHVCTSHICLLIRKTKCCTCVIRGGRGHTVSAEPGGHTSCYTIIIWDHQLTAVNTAGLFLFWAL